MQKRTCKVRSNYLDTSNHHASSLFCLENVMANTKKEMVGKTFGRLKVIKESGSSASDKTVNYVCECACGVMKTINGSHLRRGSIKSCGCKRKELAKKRTGYHGLRDHKLYSVWIDMRRRCNEPNNISYENYGKRGISVCQEWMESFVCFYDFCMENGWKKGLQIDRINNDGNYEPSNCRFVTPRINSLNRRINKKNKTGHSGVFYQKKYNTYTSRITNKGKNIYLGSFSNVEEAAKKRDEYIIDNNLHHNLSNKRR